MKSKKLLTAAVAGAMVALVGCDQGDDVNVIIGSGGTGGTSVAPPTNCPAFAIGVAVGTRAMCQISGLITDNITLTSDSDWFLNGSVRIGNGDLEIDGPMDADLQTATLTIQPGTDIFASGDSLLKITRGSQIQAAGTPAQPITFSGVDQGEEGSGEWGALIVMGFGITNENQTAPTPVNVDLEAGLGFYGGTDNADNSGTMTYVRIAESGVEVAPDEEINGLTLAGVGSATTINHIQIKGGLDDGIEWFGGAANLSHVVVTDAEDDSLDMDLGWVGNLQFAIVERNALSDRGIESDNNGSDFDAAPRTRPVLANLTMIGDGRGPVALHREGFGGKVVNALYLEDDTCIDVDNTRQEIDSGDLAYVNVILDCTNDVNDDAEDAGVDFAEALLVAGAPTNFIAANAPPITLDANFIPTTAQPAAPAAPTVQSFALSTPTFLVDTDFLGAVNPDGSDLWFDGWLIDGTF